MSTIEDVEKVRDKIILQNLLQENTDFSELRKVCKQFDTDFHFVTNGTDEELWNSVNAYFRNILTRKST